MTTIAWDGVTLAADRKRTLFNTVIPATKIFRAHRRHGAGERLYGCAGESCEAVAFRRWVTGEIKKPTLTDLHIMCVDEQHRIWEADHRLLWVEIPLKVWAIGSGSDFAMGAMYAQKTAQRAIQIACELDKNTGLGVDTLRFGRKP